MRVLTLGLIPVLVSPLLHSDIGCTPDLTEYTQETVWEGSMEPGGLVEVRGSNGKIVVEGWGRPEVRLEATKKVRAASEEQAQEILEALEIKVEREEGRIRISSRGPGQEDKIGFWRFLTDRGRYAAVSYHLRVPRETALNLHAGNGGIEVAATAGDASLVTTNGSLRLTEIRGRVQGRTTNGKIIAELVAGEGRSISLGTTNGSIRLSVSEGPSVPISVRTTNGSVRISLPRSWKAQVDASTTNGSIAATLPVAAEQSKDRRRLRGSLNGGGPLLSVRTTNGSVRIGNGGREEI